MTTAYFTPLCSSILTQVSVASADKERETYDAIALWDTGSVYTGISKDLAERMGLKPLPWKQTMHYANGESREENVYHIHITLDDSGRRADILAFEFAVDNNLIHSYLILLMPCLLNQYIDSDRLLFGIDSLVPEMQLLFQDYNHVLMQF